MERHELAVATMTWARDGEEERLLRESLPLLAEEGLPTFITDGGSGAEFVSFLESFPTFRVLRSDRPGVFPQVKSSLREAGKTGARFILYTEPDKKMFFAGRLRAFIAAAPAGESDGVTLASRSDESFATFPSFQRYTETVINRLCAEVTGATGDYTYGPFLLSRGLLARLDALEDNIAWGWRPYLFGAAARLGRQLRHWVDELPCPPEQREDDPRERIYRMRQLAQSVEGLVLSTAVTAERA